MAENNDSEDDEYISTADFGVLAPVVYHAVLVTFGFAHFKTVRDLVYVPVVKKESNCTRPTVAAGLKNSGKDRADNTEYYGDLLGGSDIHVRTRRGRSRTSATRGRTYVCSAESRRSRTRRSSGSSRRRVGSRWVANSLV